MQSTKSMVVLAACSLLLSGCYDYGDAQVEIHEPGQYQGTPDPLLEVAGTAEHEERLKKRLEMVQTDR